MTDYCTPEQVKLEVGITDAEDDPMIALSCAAASRQIESETGWQSFGIDTAVVTRTFTPTGPVDLNLLEHSSPGIASTAGLVLKIDADDTGSFETTLSSPGDYTLHPSNAAVRQPAWPYDRILLTGITWYFPRSAYRRDTIQVTALWGWPAVPDDVTKAAVIQAAQLYKAKDAVFGAISLGDTGAAMRVRAGMNPIAAGLLGPYMRPRVG